MHHHSTNFHPNPKPKRKSKPPKILIENSTVDTRDYDKEYEDWLEYQMNFLDDPDFHIYCTR